MLTVNGFFRNSALCVNTKNVVAPIGELSKRSLTYVKDIQTFQSTLNTQHELLVFTSKTSLASIVTPAALTESAMDICNWVYTQRLSTTVQISKTNFLAALAAQFQGTITDISCGSIVAGPNNTWFPQYISWKLISYTENNLMQFWFSDSAFAAQFPDYEIVVVSPLTTVDALWSTPTAALAAVDAIDPAENVEKIQAAIGDYPPTRIASYSTTYYTTETTPRTRQIAFSFLIYGEAGNDQDKLKLALQNYIIDNSDKTEAQWTTILPEVFKTTELLIYPQWTSIAIETSALTAGLYSPITGLSNYVSEIMAINPTFTEAFVRANACHLPSQYKSIGLVCIGNNSNTNTKYKVTDYFPDYLNVSSDSNDFARMSVDTRTFANALVTLSREAESLTASLTVGTGVRKVVRDNKVYVAMNVADVDLLFYAKMNLS